MLLTILFVMPQLLMQSIEGMPSKDLAIGEYQ